jgi:Zn-dependent protease
VVYSPLEIAVQIIVILFAISFHESAHAWTALKFGDPTARDLGRISLNPLRHIDPFGSVLLPLMCVIFHGPIFAYAKPTPVDLRNTRNPRMANFCVSAAGPGSNFLIAGVSLVVLLGIRSFAPDVVRAALRSEFVPGILAPIAFLLYDLVIINLILGVFNLIPIPPMDGSGILFSVLGRRGLALEMFFHRYALLMFVVIILLLNVGFFGYVLVPVLNAVRGLIAQGL